MKLRKDWKVMRVNPSAIFDILFITESLKQKYRDLNFNELNFLSYFACLMSLYEGNPVAGWGYTFYKNENGVPVSSAIAEAVEVMTVNSELMENGGYYGITEYGEANLKEYNDLCMFIQRKKYLSAVCECLLTDTIVTLLSTLSQDPVIEESKIHELKPLNTDRNTALALLHSHFKIIQEVVGIQQELYVPAYMWLQYLKLSERDDLGESNN